VPSQKETIVFQPSIFRCHVSFREAMKFAKLPKNPLDKLSASHLFSPEVRESYCLWHILPKEANGNAFVLLVAARGHGCGKLAPKNV